MPFPEIPPRTPIAIGEIIITLHQVPATTDADGNPIAEVREVFYDIAILDQEGRRIKTPHDRGDLIPFLTIAQRNGLLNFINDIRAQAEAEFLP